MIQAILASDSLKVLLCCLKRAYIPCRSNWDYPNAPEWADGSSHPAGFVKDSYGCENIYNDEIQIRRRLYLYHCSDPVPEILATPSEKFLNNFAQVPRLVRVKIGAFPLVAKPMFPPPLH